MKYLVFLSLSLLLMACGPSEKRDINFGEEDGGVRNGICPSNYAPLALFRDGFVPLPGPDSLPTGTYRLVATEAYFKVEAGSLQAHFSEAERVGEVVSRKICTSEPAERELISVEFPGLREFTRGTTDSHKASSAYIQVERKKFSFSKPAAGPIQDGSISAVLAKWDHSNIYHLSSNEFEIRLYTFETIDSYIVTKRMAMRFAFVPSSP